MPSKTKIEWTECSWNPVTGCDKISDGCKNCYAAKFAKRLKAMGNIRYKNGFDVTIHEDLITRPLSWNVPKLIFVNSMSDIFHDKIPDEVILKIFETMNKAHWHTFQVLTKRSQRLVDLSPQINWSENIWMGVSIENSSVLERSNHLRNSGAQVKFISAEPLLSSLTALNLDNIDWLIVGGESGTGSRPIEKEWVVELKDMAQASSTAFFFKQWGGFNKKKAGSLLDGVEYKEYPKKIKVN